jgi:hypothetical protein
MQVWVGVRSASDAREPVTLRPEARARAAHVRGGRPLIMAATALLVVGGIGVATRGGQRPSRSATTSVGHGRLSHFRRGAYIVGPATLGPIPAGFVSLSMEALSATSPTLRADSPLGPLLRRLGPVRYLRFGGTSLDQVPHWRGGVLGGPEVLTDAALLRIAHLAAKTNTRIVLGLNLALSTGSSTASTRSQLPSVVDEAVHARRILGPWLAAFELGNEPDAFAAEGLRPSIYRPFDFAVDTEHLRQRLRGAGVRTPLWGPDVADTGQLSETAIRSYSALTSHFYATSHCRPYSTDATALLSILAHRRLDTVLGTLLARARSAHVPAWLGETNSVACGGQPGVSDAFAGALWGADTLLTAATHGVAGVMIHFGNAGCDGYAPLCVAGNPDLRAPTSRWQATPLYYAMVIASDVEGATPLSVVLPHHTPGGEQVFAVRTALGVVRWIVVNNTPKGLTLPIELTTGTHPTVCRLQAPGLESRTQPSWCGAHLQPSGTMTPLAPEAIAVQTSPGPRVSLDVPPYSIAELTVPSQP